MLSILGITATPSQSVTGAVRLSALCPVLTCVYITATPSQSVTGAVRLSALCPVLTYSISVCNRSCPAACAVPGTHVRVDGRVEHVCHHLQQRPVPRRPASRQNSTLRACGASRRPLKGRQRPPSIHTRNGRIPYDTQLCTCSQGVSEERAAHLQQKYPILHTLSKSVTYFTQTTHTKSRFRRCQKVSNISSMGARRYNLIHY